MSRLLFRKKCCTDTTFDIEDNIDDDSGLSKKHLSDTEIRELCRTELGDLSGYG